MDSSNLCVYNFCIYFEQIISLQKRLNFHYLNSTDRWRCFPQIWVLSVFAFPATRWNSLYSNWEIDDKITPGSFTEKNPVHHSSVNRRMAALCCFSVWGRSLNHVNHCLVLTSQMHELQTHTWWSASSGLLCVFTHGDRGH